MLDVHSLLVPAELSLILSFLLRGGGFRRRCFTQGTFRSKPAAMPWVSCSYACACFSRRENARRSFAPRSCGTIAHSLIFAPRRRLPPLFIFRKAIFAQNPRQRRGFLALMPAPAFRVAKMLDVLSLLVPAELSLTLSFLLRGGGFRRRLFHARQFSLKTHGFCRGFLALMPAPALRVAKMQDVHSLLVPAELSLFLSFLLRGGGFRRRCFTQGTFRSKPTAFAVGFLLLCLRLLFASRKC